MPNWFIALPISPGEWFERVPDPPHGFRRFHALDLHATVAFLGNVGEERARAAWSFASRWPVGAVEATLGQVVPMGNPRRYSALSIELVRGQKQVSEGIGAVRDLMCDAAEVPRDERPARPHITLARPSRKASRDERQAGLRWAESILLGEPAVRIDRMALYTWALDRKERLFRTVETYAFG